MNALFGPGTPYPTAFEAIAGALAYRDQWQKSDASWIARDDADFVDRVRAIVDGVNTDARRAAMADKSFSSRVMPTMADRKAARPGVEDHGSNFPRFGSSGSEPTHTGLL